MPWEEKKKSRRLCADVCVCGVLQTARSRSRASRRGTVRSRRPTTPVCTRATSSVTTCSTEPTTRASLSRFPTSTSTESRRSTCPIHTGHQTRQDGSCLCRVCCAGVNWTIALNVFRLQIFYRRQTSSVGRECRESSSRRRNRRNNCRRDSFVVSGVAV